MDFDGIEHFILQNGPDVLSNIQGILVEINDNFIEQSEKSKEALERAGLTLKEKLHSKMFEDTKFSSSYNQIWSRIWKMNFQKSGESYDCSASSRA